MPFSPDELSRLVLPETGNARLLVALSGGPDSTALLRRLCELSRNANLEIAAAHVNHNLRGAESQADESFCATLCAELAIPYYLIALELSRRDEATLRESRYAGLLAMARKHNYRYIATGHNLDDQVETLLFRLFRGTSTNGLQGIPSSRILAGGIRVVRPMLAVRRSSILSYLAQLKQNYRTDSSNLSSDYNRNFIRNELLPLISERFGDVVPRIEQLRSMIAQDEYVFDELTETRAAAMFSTPDSCPLSAFLSEPPALQRRIIAAELRSRGVEVSSERIGSILELATTGGAISLNEEWRAVVKNERLYFDQMSDDEEPAAYTSHVERPLQIGLNIIPELGCAVNITVQNGTPSGFPPATADEAVIELRSSPETLIARRRRAGDIIKPFGMTEPVRLKRYLQTHRRGDGTHAGHPVVIATNEEIIWVPGVGLSNSARVNENATHRLEFMQLSSDELPFA